jgi:serine/threonine protein kinase
VYEKILSARVEFPRHLDTTARDFIKRLLVPDPTKRLGSGNCSAAVLTAGSTSSFPLAFSKSQAQLINQSLQTRTHVSANEPKVFLTESDDSASNESQKSTIQSFNDFGLTSMPVFPVYFDLSSTFQPNSNNPNVSLESNISHTQKQKINTGCDEIKRHRWFISIQDWSDVFYKRMKPPFRPEVLHEGDTRNFEKYDTPDLSKVKRASQKEVELFYNF